MKRDLTHLNHFVHGANGSLLFAGAVVLLILILVSNGVGRARNR